MATEEEAREAADGEEVQVEATDLGTTHLQTNLDSKLSSHGEIKDEGKTMDSTGGMLKVTEGQVLEKAPSVVEIPPEHTPKVAASYLNGHLKEAKISYEKPQENGQKDNEQVEASSAGISTDQSNKSNGEEAVDSFGHVESTTEDTSLLKDENEEPKEHYKQDEGTAVGHKMVHEDTLQTDEPAVNAQQGQDLEPAEVTEDTQHASTSCIPHDEVVAEAPAGVQTSLEPNIDNSGALPDATDGNTETEPAKVDKESFPEDNDIAEHTNEIIKLEDQPSKQTDDVDAEVVHEEVPKLKNTDVPEDTIKTEQADESTNDDQEELNQEPPEESSEAVHEKTEEISHESNASAYKETTPEHHATREPALDVQEMQSQGLAEEIADAKEVDTEQKVQQSGVAFEEAPPEDNVPATEPHSDIVVSEEIESLEDAKAEETYNQSNVTIAEDAAQDKEAAEDIQPVQRLEEEEPKSTGTVEIDEASNQPHANVLNNLAEEDGLPTCPPQVIELEEVKDTGATETQEIAQQSHVAASEELVQNDDIQQTLEQGSVEVKDREASETQKICHETVEDDVTAEGPTSDAQEVQNIESVEEIKNNTADNIVEASNVVTVEEADQENNVLTSEDVSEQQTRELEPEEIQITELVETEEASDQRHPALLNDPAQEDSIPSDIPKTESTAEVTETEATKTEALPQESNVSISEEPASEENITASEITCDTQEVNNLAQAEDVEGNKDTRTEEISDQSNESNVASLEMATEDNTTILTDVSIQQLQEQEPVEFRDTEATEPQVISPSHILSTSEESAPEDNVTAEPSPDTQAENFESATVTEETEDVKSSDAIAEEETPEEHVQEFEAPVHTPVEQPELEETNNTDNQMDAVILENPTHGDNPTTGESLVLESVEVTSSEATEGQQLPQSEVTQSEDHETEENTTASKPKVPEPEPAEEMRDCEATEPRSISQQSIVSSSEESVPEEDVTAKEPASDTKEVPAEEPELIEEHNDVKAGEISNKSSGTIVAETAEDNLESATVTEETPEEHVQESEAPVGIPPVEQPELEEPKNTEPVKVHDNVMTNDLPAAEVKDIQATEVAEIHNESGDLTEDVKSNVALTDEAAPDEHAKATADIPQVQDPELEETKNSEPVEVEDNMIASDLPEEIKDTEAVETEVIPDESTSAKITELANDALAEEAVPEKVVTETEVTIDIPRAQEPEVEEIKNTEPVEVEENIPAADQSAEEIEETDAMETEAINESIDANNSQLTEDVTAKEPASDIKEVQTEEPELIDEHNDVRAQENLESATVTEETRDVKSTDATAEETPEELVQESEAPVGIPQVEEPELKESKNTEPVEMQDNATTNDLPEEEVKDTEATEIAEIQNESDDLTEDVESNVALADEAAPKKDAKATEAAADIPQAQEPEQEEIKDSEPVEVEDNKIASDLPEEEIKDTEAMETEVNPDESACAKITEHTNDVKSNVALAEEAAPEEHVIETEATTDIPRAQEPELEEIKNTEPVEVEENITATDQSAEENEAIDAMETEANNKSIDANSSELTEDVEALEDEAAHEENLIAAETTVQIPRGQEPELEEIKNAEHIEVEENITASDLPAEEVKETEDTETEVISESADANISEPTEDVKKNVAVADEAAPEEHVIATEVTYDIPRAQEPGLEEIENAEHVEVDENISASDLPAEEVKETEDTETEVESTDALADEGAPEEQVLATEATVDISRAQEPELEETENAEHAEVEENISANDLPAEEVKDTETMETEAISDSTDANITELTEGVALAAEAVPEPVEAEDGITADDVPVEEINDTEVMETEEIPHESRDNSLTASAPLADIQQSPEQEVVEDKCTDMAQNKGEPRQNIVCAAAEPTPTEEKPTVTDLASNVQQVLERDSTEETRGFEDDQQHGVSNLEKPVLESEPNVADQEVQEDKTAEVEDTEAMETEEISIQDSIPATENAAQESSEPGSDPDLLVQSEDIKEELVKAEETGQSNGATLEEPTAEGNAANETDPLDDTKQDHGLESVERNNGTDATEDNAANETDPLDDTKQDHGLESVEGNNGIDATEVEEASHPTSQDTGLEELVSENNVATTESTSDTQQVDDLGEADEMTATEAINDEEISYKKTEAATLEDPSPTDNGTSPKQNSLELDEETLGTEINNAEPIEQKGESSDLGEKTAFTTQKGETPTEEDVVQISGEDKVGISNSIEKIKEQSEAVTEDDAIKSGEHTSDQDDGQLHSVELQMQVCERSVNVSATEQPDDDIQKVNLDHQQKEDEAIEEQSEEIQKDEQKHDDSSADLTSEALLEPQSNEIGTTNLNEDTDLFEAEQTETVATEMLMNEQTVHIPQESIPRIADVKVGNSTEIEATPEQQNAPNNTGTLYTDADAENYNEDEKENIETDAAAAKPSTDEQDGTSDESINEEVGYGLASPIEKDLQETSEPAPSNEEMLENSTTVVPQNVEPRVHREEEECTNKANDDMQAIQVSEEEIVDKVEKKKQTQNEDTDVNNDEIQTKPADEETSELPSNDSTDTKVDDTMSHYTEMIHGRIDAQATDTEEVEEYKDFSSVSENDVEKSQQNDVEQDLSNHPKVVDDKLATAEQNDAEVETNSNEEMVTSYTIVTEAVKFDEAIYDKASGADGALSDENIETFEDNRRNLEASSTVTASGESMDADKEHHNLALSEHSAVDGNTTEQASGLEVTERGLLFPAKPLPTESEAHEESQTTKEQDEEDIHEQETGDMEKEEKEAEQSDLPVSNFLMNLIMGKERTEPDGNSEPETEKKQEETTKYDSCLITSQQEESFVPIPDNKLIFEQGKHNLEDTEETHDLKLQSDEELSRNTHDLEAPVGQNNLQGKISSELPGGPGLMTEVETRDVKLGEKATNSVCQEHIEATPQIEEGILESNPDDSTDSKASQEDTLEEGQTETDLQHESLPEDRSSDAVAGQTLLSTEPDTGAEKKLPNDTDDVQSPLSTKREESTESSIMEAESTIDEELENEVEKEEEKQHTANTGGATEGHIENLHDDLLKGIEAISDEQTGEITEPVIGTEINLVHEKEISAGSECEDEKQSSYKLPNSELDISEKALDIQSDGSSLHINQDKQDEFAGDQIVMEKNLLDKPGESNLHEEQETEIGQESPKESDGGDQNCLATREPVIEEDNSNRAVERHVQTVNTTSSEEQETFMSKVQEREAPEAEENVVETAKPVSTNEEQSPKGDKSNMAGEKTYDEKTKGEEEAKSSTGEAMTKIEGAVQKASHNQTRDLNVVLPTKAPGSEESFVDIKTPEFSTDEEQSPKDESNMAEEKSSDMKTNGDEEAKNSTDETPIKNEEREAGQKASPKKHNILSGVGSKVKHQLAKVKKAIIGKPGHTKSELAKS